MNLLCLANYCLHFITLYYMKQPYPVRVFLLLAANGALPAADIVIAGQVSPVGCDLQQPLLLHLFHLLFLGFL